MAGRLGTGEQRRGIQSVEIGLRVLSAVAAQAGPATLSSIAQRAQLSASQTHRYLSSLMASGMVKQDSRSSLYDLDAGAIRIGLSALSRLDVFAAADETFQQLAKETRRTCQVTVWGDAGPTVVRWFAGNPPVVTSLAIGSALPVLQSATGHIYYAFGDEAQTAPRVAEEAALGGWTPERLAELKERTRRLLCSTVQGDLIPGLRAAAAPVFDLQGRLVLVSSLIATAAFPTAQDRSAWEALLAACRRLTESLGGRWPEPAPAEETIVKAKRRVAAKAT